MAWGSDKPHRSPALPKTACRSGLRRAISLEAEVCIVSQGHSEKSARYNRLAGDLLGAAGHLLVGAPSLPFPCPGVALVRVHLRSIAGKFRASFVGRRTEGLTWSGRGPISSGGVSHAAIPRSTGQQPRSGAVAFEHSMGTERVMFRVLAAHAYSWFGWAERIPVGSDEATYAVNMAGATGRWIFIIALVVVVWLLFSGKGKRRRKQRGRGAGKGTASSKLATVTVTCSTGEPEGRAPLRWIEPGERVTVAGRTITSGFFYVSDGAPKLAEASAINLRLSVRFVPLECVPRPDYYPMYSSLTPEQRGAYIDWLARGRKDGHPEERDLGFVFLFFYGIERRLLVEQKHSLDLINELPELMNRYAAFGRSKSLPAYTCQLLHFWGHAQGSENYERIWSWVIREPHAVTGDAQVGE